MNQDFNTPDALPQGTQIGEDYTILRVLGQGGFGITYLAQDEMMGGQVVIKENMPADFAARDHDTLRLTPRLRQEENYTWARERFLDEARMLHRLHHSNIVPVTRAFSALNTAYYVMPHVGAAELGQTVRNTPNGRSEAYLAPLLRQLLEALDYLHGKELLHRDLKPSNILMSEEGVPIIIDFGAARATVSGRTHTMLESPGYTPIEQLKQHGNVGPWTDLYSLGATFYSLITGSLPPRSIDRMDEDDPYEPLAARADLRQQYSRRFLAGIDKALEVRIKRRWQKAADWANELPAPQPTTPKTATNRTGENSRPVPPAPSPTPHTTPYKLWVGISAILTLLLLGSVGYIFLTQRSAPVVHHAPRTLSAKLLREIKHGDEVSGVAFSPNSKFLATGSRDKTARITDIATGNTIREIKHDKDVWNIAYSPHGKFLAISINDWPNYTARITEVATGDTIREIKHGCCIQSVAFSPDGESLATGSWDNTARITNIATGNTIREIKHDKDVWGIAYSPDGQFLATGSFNKTARITEVATGRTIREIKHDSTVVSVAFSPDGKLLATGSADNTARITEVATGRTIREIKQDNTVNSVAFSPDGQFLATGNQNHTACITEVATGRTIQEIKHDNMVNSVAFSPDGKFLATGSSDNTARIYELKETAE